MNVHHILTGRSISARQPWHMQSNSPTRNTVVLPQRCDPGRNPIQLRNHRRASRTSGVIEGVKNLRRLSLCFLLRCFPRLLHRQRARRLSRLCDAVTPPTATREGNLKKLPPAEHMRRAAVYLSVRAFAEARAHWQTLIDNYPQDPRVPEAMLGIGRSYFLEKAYENGYRRLQSNCPGLRRDEGRSRSVELQRRFPAAHGPVF